VAVCSLAGLAIGTAIAFSLSPVYTSSATIRMAPAQLPERFVPDDSMTLDIMLRNSRDTVLSRSALTKTIQSHELYRTLRRRLPVEEVIERMRQDIRIAVERSGSVRVAFSYEDPVLAQRVTRDLVTGLIDENLREQSMRFSLTTRFLADQAAAAAARWTGLIRLERAAEAKGDAAELQKLFLDRDMARQDYVSFRSKQREAELTELMWRRRQGVTLEVLDLPSRPEMPDGPDRVAIASAGLAAGFVLGLLLRLRASRNLPGGSPLLPSPADI
jgi:uncharacterized protein involved in exopolysaccharide biosynthesis